MKENILIIDPGTITERRLLSRETDKADQKKTSALIQKVLFLFKISGVLCAIPFVIVMRISRPFILVRLGALDIGRIGGYF